MNWEIIFYQKENGEAPVKTFLESLPQKHRMKATKEIDLLQKYGLYLGMPYMRSLQGSRYKGICELRIQQGNDISRIFYFLPMGNAFVLLHGFIKKSQKTPIQELEKALRYKEDYLRRYGDHV